MNDSTKQHQESGDNMTDQQQKDLAAIDRLRQLLQATNGISYSASGVIILPKDRSMIELVDLLRDLMNDDTASG